MGTRRKHRESDPRKPSARKARHQRTDDSPSRGRSRRLRCPFQAKFPSKVRSYKTSCQNTGFETNARVIEHLKRAHGPIELSDGIAGAKGDILQSPPQTSADDENERVTQEQLVAIAQLPRNSDAKAKWDSIYKIIFPGEEDVKPAYMPSLERLRDHARNPPEWLVTDMSQAIGASQQEIISTLQNFLIFFDVVGGSSPSLSESIIQPRRDGGPETFVGPSSIDDMDDMDDNSEAGYRGSHKDMTSKIHDFETSSPAHGSPTRKSITDIVE